MLYIRSGCLYCSITVMSAVLKTISYRSIKMIFLSCFVGILSLGKKSAGEKNIYKYTLCIRIYVLKLTICFLEQGNSSYVVKSRYSAHFLVRMYMHRYTHAFVYIYIHIYALMCNIFSSYPFKGSRLGKHPDQFCERIFGMRLFRNIGYVIRALITID